MGKYKKNDLVKFKSSYWTNAATKLLLNEYKKNINDFRTPAIKKKILWTRIALRFKKFGVDIPYDQLSRKFRNLKTTYMKVKNNSVRRNSWPFTKIMNEIFHSDHSNSSNINAIIDVSSLDNSSALKEISEDDTGKINFEELPKEINGNKDNRSTASHEKNEKARNLYGQRNKQLDLYVEKNQILKKLEKNVEKNSIILLRNAETWEKGIHSLVEIMKEKNEIMKERNDILRSMVNKLDKIDVSIIVDENQNENTTDDDLLKCE